MVDAQRVQQLTHLAQRGTRLLASRYPATFYPTLASGRGAGQGPSAHTVRSVFRPSSFSHDAQVTWCCYASTTYQSVTLSLLFTYLPTYLPLHAPAQLHELPQQSLYVSILPVHLAQHPNIPPSLTPLPSPPVRPKSLARRPHLPRHLQRPPAALPLPPALLAPHARRKETCGGLGRARF